MPVTIKVRLNGPYLVDLSQGDVTIVDHEGNPIPIPTEKPNIVLCRCGASTTKPFCDGSHSRIGFAAAEAAQREADTGAHVSTTPQP
jgi:CDGSH-type Zn-finger protein